MTEKSKDQLRDHVERQLADKGSLLTFSPMVKARYEEETGTARCRHLGPVDKVRQPYLGGGQGEEC